MRREAFVKRWDIVIILLAFFLTGFSAFKVYIGPQNAGQVLIQSRDGQWIFPLDAEEHITVSGPLGNTVLRIHNNQAWVESSPCGNQICVAAGPIQNRLIWIACLPNNVFLMIEGREIGGNEVLEYQVDAVAW